jgi:AmmeMemoRadiSam system protein A
MHLSHDEKKTLIRLARTTLETFALEHEELHTPPPGFDITGLLSKPAGVFVTLHEDGELRGCIGYIEPVKPLYLAVMENAVSAAFRDYRFLPVEPAELDKIDIEISVLTPKEQIASAETFIPGKHGIIMEAEERRAVFLPQVAAEQGWNRETTLWHLCLKAGLPGNAWEKGAKFWVFCSEVFGEKNEQ